jgi:hypothetical protein
MNINKRIFVLILLIVPLRYCYANTIGHKKIVPVIYCTDLFHPHVDPDDHFDIACLYAIEEIEIKAIILDQGQKQKKRPGSIPILWQAKEYQAGVELILKILKASKGPVTIITVGSLRDIAAGYNRSPDLFKTRVDRMFIFIGEASEKGHVEYNVGLDKNAYIRIMNSGLPVYWVPCFDGGRWQNNGRASYWRASHEDLLGCVSAKVMNYFIYALLQKNENNPVQYLVKQVSTDDRKKVLSMNRNLWCTAVFAHIAGRKFIRQQNKFISVPMNASYNKEQEIRPFRFDEVSVFADDQANVSYEDTNRAVRIRQFHVLTADIYPEVMTSVTAQLLLQLKSCN